MAEATLVTLDILTSYIELPPVFPMVIETEGRFITFRGKDLFDFTYPRAPRSEGAWLQPTPQRLLSLSPARSRCLCGRPDRAPCAPSPLSCPLTRACLLRTFYYSLRGSVQLPPPPSFSAVITSRLSRTPARVSRFPAIVCVGRTNLQQGDTIRSLRSTFQRCFNG